MCLDAAYNEETDEYEFRKKPYNTSKFRWKMLFVGVGKNLVSPFQDDEWKVGKTYKANANGNPDHGFHVYTTKTAAARLAYDEANYVDCVVVKVRVSGFVAGGTYGDNTPCETWKTAKIVEVWTGAGRYNITNRYTK